MNSAAPQVTSPGLLGQDAVSFQAARSHGAKAGPGQERHVAPVGLGRGSTTPPRPGKFDRLRELAALPASSPPRLTHHNLPPREKAA